MTKQIITQAELKEQLHYDHDTGLFKWLVANSKRIKVGEIAGTVTDKGYVRIAINKKGYKAHRLAWLYMTGEMPIDQIDHINGNRSNNKFSNLRPATKYQNQKNMGKMPHNTSGFKGVFLLKNNRWMAQARLNGSVNYLGSFDTAEEASIAYDNFAKLNHGDFYRDSRAT